MQNQETGGHTSLSAKGLRTPAHVLPYGSLREAHSGVLCQNHCFHLGNKFFLVELAFRETEVRIQFNELISKWCLVFLCLVGVSLLYVVQSAP